MESEVSNGDQNTCQQQFDSATPGQNMVTTSTVASAFISVDDTKNTVPAQNVVTTIAAAPVSVNVDGSTNIDNTSTLPPLPSDSKRQDEGEQNDSINNMSIDESSSLIDQSMDSQKGDTNKAGGEKNIGPLDSLQSQTTTTTTTVDDGPESKNNEGEANTNDIDQDTPKPAESTATAATTMTTSDLPAAALPPSAAAESHEPSSPAEEPIKTPPPEPAAEPTSSQNQQGPREVPLPEDSIYHLKWFEWKGIQTPIITQNENGPCPLLAIANVLILARKIELPPMQQIISGKQLMEYIGDCILSSAPDQEPDNEELILNYQQNMQDAIDIMYKLQTGIDVNVKFTNVFEFEFTRECIVFDLLKIALYHGWLVDPQDGPVMKAVHNLSYNQIVEKMLTSQDACDDDVLSEGLAIEDFLGRTASQLTYHGLCELNNTVQEEELCVFFRNNHFSTLYKHKGELFLLVTDQGFLTEPAVIWETLLNIEGDGQFVNSEYRTIQLESNIVPPPLAVTSTVSPQLVTATTSTTPAQPATSDTSSMTNLSQEDQDYLIALSLQQERNDGDNGSSPVVQLLPTTTTPLSLTSSGPDGNSNNKTKPSQLDRDHALALQLQDDEDRRAQEQQQQQQQQPVSNQHERQATRPQQQPQPQQQRQQEGDKCSIL